jgi:hypothetical protein
VTAQLPFAGIVPPLSVTLPALLASDPEQVFDGTGELAMLRPLGRVSVSAIPVSAYALLFVKVTVSVESVLVLTLAGEKVAPIPGATGAVTVRVALAAVVVVPAGPVDSALAAMAFV